MLLEFVLFESVFESFESVSSELVGKDASSVTSIATSVVSISIDSWLTSSFVFTDVS